jgi:hypothetical protein
MEYFREPHNKIQAGFALHVGKLLTQYGGNCSPPLGQNQVAFPDQLIPVASERVGHHSAIELSR